MIFKVFMRKNKKRFPIAFIVRARVITVPLSANVMAPTCFNPFLAISFLGPLYSSYCCFAHVPNIIWGK